MNEGQFFQYFGSHTSFNYFPIFICILPAPFVFLFLAKHIADHRLQIYTISLCHQSAYAPISILLPERHKLAAKPAGYIALTCFHKKQGVSIIFNNLDCHICYSLFSGISRAARFRVILQHELFKICFRQIFSEKTRSRSLTSEDNWCESQIERAIQLIYFIISSGSFHHLSSFTKRHPEQVYTESMLLRVE